MGKEYSREGGRKEDEKANEDVVCTGTNSSQEYRHALQTCTDKTLKTTLKSRIYKTHITYS